MEEKNGWLTFDGLRDILKKDYEAIKKLYLRKKFTKIKLIDGVRGGHKGKRPLVHITDPYIPADAKRKYLELLIRECNTIDDIEKLTDEVMSWQDDVTFEIYNSLKAEKVKEILSINLPAKRDTSETAIMDIWQRKGKEIGLARLDIIRKADNYIAANSNISKVQAVEEFILLYNNGDISQKLLKITGGISRRTLYRWMSQCPDRMDYEALIPKYHIKKEKSSISPIEKSILLKLMCNPKKLNLGTAYKLMCIKLEEMGITPKSIDSYRAFLKEFTKKFYDVWVFYREGEKARHDLVAPYFKRDRSVLAVNDVWFADGHRLAFKVVNPFTGKPVRPMVVFYYDWYSGYPTGFYIMVEENTQCIAAALREGILNCGKPKFVYLDNGKAFKSRFFTQDVDLEAEGFGGLYGKLDIRTIFAAPYNARVKVVERFFRELQESFEKLMPSYLGNNIQNRPAHYRRNEKEAKARHKEYIPTIEEVSGMISSWIGWYVTNKHPEIKDKTIKEVFEKGLDKAEKINKDELDDLMMSAEIRKLSRSQVRFLGREYFNDEIYGYNGEVQVRYSLFDLSTIKLYTPDGDYLCEAYVKEAIHPLAKFSENKDDYETLKRMMAERKRFKRQTREIGASIGLEGNVSFVAKGDALVVEMEDKKRISRKPKEIPPDMVEDEKPASWDEPPMFRKNSEKYYWLLEKEKAVGLTNEEIEWVINFEEEILGEATKLRQDFKKNIKGA